jgi:hypothetical protein
MTRRTVPPRRVEALARECRSLLVWLRGPGNSADAEAYGVARRAYLALVDAVAMLPRGPKCLRDEEAAPPMRRAYPFAKVDRDAQSFTADELVALEESVLTRQGLLVPAPLVPHVDRELLAMLDDVNQDVR